METTTATTTATWRPNPGPQSEAYHCDADVIGYGGAAGGGKTDLALGMAGTKHYNSVIFRRVFTSAEEIIERSHTLWDGLGRYNGQSHRWKFADRIVRFASIPMEKDKRKYQGQARSLMVFDEAPEFSESQIRFVMGWNRSTDPRVKQCQALLTFNPPMDDSQAWIVTFFAPWLDEGYDDPAQPGEIRYVARIDDRDMFYRTPEDAPESVRATLKTRTFFRAVLSDNPQLAATDYGATIENMPEPLRSILKGQFDAGSVIDPWQVIPTAWIKAAQERWKQRPKPDRPLSAIGADIAHGGADKTVIAKRYGDWFDQLLKYAGKETPTGQAAAGLILQAMGEDLVIPNIDAIGYGASAADDLISRGYSVNAVNVSMATTARDRTGRFTFKNVRAELHWKLREALDPSRNPTLALPPDSELLGDLKAPQFSISAGGIAIEEKKRIKERIGRSPDCGEAVMLALIESFALFGFAGLDDDDEQTE